MSTILPENYLQLCPAGPARTTTAGRFAIPVRVKLGPADLGVFDLVYDGKPADGLYGQLVDHLSGRGTSPQEEPCSEADLQ